MISIKNDFTGHLPKNIRQKISKITGKNRKNSTSVTRSYKSYIMYKTFKKIYKISIYKRYTINLTEIKYSLKKTNLSILSYMFG